MIEILQILVDHPIATLFAATGIGIGVKAIAEAAMHPYQLRLEHKEKMAEIEARTATARALAAAPDEAQRNELARQLLEAYDEAGEDLRNDEKGTLVRWSMTKDD